MPPHSRNAPQSRGKMASTPGLSVSSCAPFSRSSLPFLAFSGRYLPLSGCCRIVRPQSFLALKSQVPAMTACLHSPESLVIPGIRTRRENNNAAHAVRVCCPEQNDEGSAFTADIEKPHWLTSRRDLLGCFAVVVGLEIISCSAKFTESASAADIIQRKQRSEFQVNIKDTLTEALKGKPDLIPSVLTLALNDAMTYDKATKSGGPNGSIRFSSEMKRPENASLVAALDLLTEAKRQIDSYSKGGPISYADLIQFAAQAAIKKTFLDSAIRKCGGNEDKGRILYTAYGSNGQWGLFEKQFGRVDAEEPDPEGRIPQWGKASVPEMKDKFSALGFGPRQLAVMSAFLGPDQSTTERLLASDPDVRPWVEKYQRSRDTVSQTDYEVDLITTLTKMSALGQKINYEAYTYPLQRIELSKLKL